MTRDTRIGILALVMIALILGVVWFAYRAGMFFR
jgi:cbb3-type cytochrome oxidase subunit 3